MNAFQALRHKLLRIPLSYKILLANCAIVVLGAVAGTVITVWHVRQFPEDIHYELIILFAGAGVVISFVVNNWVLKRALAPMDRLQEAVNQIRAGESDVHVALGDTSDDRFDRLAETFNQMVEQLEENAREKQALSQRIIRAQEEERQRLARELHDEAAQALTSLLVHLRLLERAKTPQEAQGRVVELRELTAQALEEVRRVAVDLRPTILDDLGLGPALEWRVDELNRSDTIEATFSTSGLEQRLPREVELVFYRIGQEALSNVARHADAHQVQVALQGDTRSVTLEVVDNGAGFKATQLGNGPSHGLGLVGMRERIGMVDGHLTIESMPGKGTRIMAQAPLIPNPTRSRSEHSGNGGAERHYDEAPT